MQIGCSAPTSGPLIAPDSLVRIATEAEMLGFDYVTVSDHVMIPKSIASRYPYSEFGRISFRRGCGAAGATDDRRVHRRRHVEAAHRHLGDGGAASARGADRQDTGHDRLPVEGAADVGHRRRLVREEFEAIGAPPFEDRGHVTDEWMMACKELWSSDDPKFDGKYVKFADVVFTPKPVQKSIPIWVGGESGPALRRTAKYADAWYPIGTNPQFPMDTLTRFKGGAAKLRDLTKKFGRDPASVGLTYRVSSNPEAQPKGTVDGERKLFTGGAADYAGDIRALAEVGVTAFDFGLFGPTLAATLDNMRRFKDEVMAKVK